MKSIEINSIRNFTSQLFTGTVFDPFLTVEASFCTACTWSVDGHFNDGFFDEEEQKLPENREGIICWKAIRPICFSMIKGKKVPKQFKIVFKMPEKETADFLRIVGIGISLEQIGGLFLNINYKGGKLFCTTGSALKLFSMDKSLEIAWDEYMEKWLRQFG